MTYIANKNALIITYYWPPAGGPGVQRVLKFVKYLPRFGWNPIILTVENGEYPARDESLISEIPADIKVYKTKTLEPYGIYKRLLRKKRSHKIDTYVLNKKNVGPLQRLMKWIRLNVFIPDARIGWYTYAVNKGRKIIPKENIDIIYSCSPPHSLQLIARSLAIKTKIPWVADLRDPWSEIVSYQGQDRNRITKSIDNGFEKKVLHTADKIIVTCHGLKTAFEKDYAVPDQKINVITNGYDKTSHEITNTRDEDILRIFYAGNLSSVRTPHALLNAIKILKTQSIDYDIHFVIAGQANEEFWSIVNENGIEEMVKYMGYISHQEVLDQYALADILLLVVDDVPDNHLFIAGKLFDYMGSKKPILALGPKGGEVHQIIDQTDSGFFFGYKEGDKVAHALKTTIMSKKEGSQLFSFSGIEKYNREALTSKLAKVFDELL